jgi:hypothetical protein
MTVREVLWRLGRRTRATIESSLKEIGEKLQHLARSNETDFLAVGGRLERIMSHARAEVQTIAQMNEAVRERRQPALIRALTEVREWTGRAEAATSSEPLLAALDPPVRAAGDPLYALTETVRILRVLSFSTRIESAWLGERAANFQALSGEVRSLADAIEAKVSALGEARESLLTLLEGAHRTASEQERAQRNKLLDLANRCAAGLEELHREQDRISHISGVARSDYEKVARGIGEIVIRLQSHDSVRQRLEHIIESLQHAREGISGRAPMLGPASALQYVELQKAQLRQAQDAFLSAIGDIQEQLRQIGEIVGDYPRRSRELSGQGRPGDPDAASRMESHLLDVAGNIEELEDSRRILAAAAEEVQAASARMVGFVEDIEALGERLMRLGLNAEVQAVRLADCGAVMESVASSIRRTAQSASENAKVAGAALRELVAPAARLSAAFVRRGDSALADPDEVASSLRRATRELTETRAETDRLLVSMAEGAEMLSHGIAALRSGITADRVAEEVASSCLEALTRVSDVLRAKSGRMRQSPDAGGVERAKAIYTMSAERDAHATFARSAGVGVADRDEAEWAQEKAFGVDDNVELF